jgi:hypothetical protein
MDNRELALVEGYHIFYVASNEEGGPEIAAQSLTLKIREAQKDWDIEFLSNAKIDADSGGHGRAIYFGYQCVVLRPKSKSYEKAISKPVIKK